MSHDEETVTTAALVGATGGAGTTRSAVELAALLAADGRSVAVLDAAFGTQGLADYLDGRLAPDLTALVTDAVDEELAAGLVELDLQSHVPGRVACCPAHAPFERLARAKTAGAARELEARIEEATATFDHVLVDVPPVAANQAIAAVDACERVALVAPGSDRGADAVGRMRARLTDLGTAADVVVATRGTLDAADVTVPASSATAVADAPASTSPDDDLTPAMSALADVLYETTIDPTFETRGLLDSARQYVSR